MANYPHKYNQLYEFLRRCRQYAFPALFAGVAVSSGIFVCYKLNLEEEKKHLEFERRRELYLPPKFPGSSLEKEQSK